ncbi:ATP-grasp domain-containing protein [bacterium]|nr:ATP-grasp domain-containing protein [bacterium]
MPKKRVLIANRGEIAARIARTAHRLNIETIGIVSAHDPAQDHLSSCTHQRIIPDREPAELFLSPEYLAELAQREGASLLHPGYGFLSESPLLAEACEKTGTTFIGPNPALLRLFGDKQKTKERAESRKIPVLTATTVEMETTAGQKALHSLAKSARFPLLVKARAGGGGRGMRLVHNPTDLEEQCASAAREAEKFFLDGTLLIEPYLEKIKHIEVQIAADRSGDTIHLFERECSAQRNYQKILEEAPANSISETVKEALFRDAVHLLSELSYSGLATVEFLVTEAGEYFFTEVNPRLQVEHTVTEEVLGIDLVELQFHLAEGGTLGDFENQLGRSSGQPLTSLSPQGYALQARVNAEDALSFQPDAGRVRDLSFPAAEEGFRLETGISAGSLIVPFFDSLLFKVIHHGRDREEVTQKMERHLLQITLIGVETNIPFLLRMLQSGAWCDGTHTTQHAAAVQRTTPPLHKIAQLHCCASYLAQRSSVEEEKKSSWARGDRFAVVQHESSLRRAIIKGCDLTFSVDQHGPSSFSFTFLPLEGEESAILRVSGLQWCDDSVFFLADGVGASFRVSQVPEGWWVLGPYLATKTVLLPPLLREKNNTDSMTERSLTSPLPGTVIEVRKKVGDLVKSGDTILLLESMKMEHPLESKVSGTVQSLSVATGDTVHAGELLAVVAPEER